MADLFNIDKQVATVLRAKCVSKFQNTFPNIYVTTSDKNVKNPAFPNIYVKDLESVTIGETVGRNSITGLRSYIQIEVTDNEKEKTCKDIMKYIIGLMTKMKYQLVATPFTDNTTSDFRCICRFRRALTTETTFLGIK